MLNFVNKAKTKRWQPKILWVCGAILTFDIVDFRLPGPNYFKAKQTQLAVATQLPLGSDKSQVVAFLDGRGLEHSGHSPQSFHFQPIGAVVRGVSWGFVAEVDMAIEFSFDGAGKLNSVTTERWFTSP